MADKAPASDDYSGYPRLEDQIKWYDKRSISAQRNYRALKTVQIVVAAAIPVMSLLDRESTIIPGVLGALVLVLEGFQELGMYRQNWQKYRASCESLRHEKYMYMAGAGAYSSQDPDDARRILAERVEVLISQEHSNWLAQFKDTNDGERREKPA